MNVFYKLAINSFFVGAWMHLCWYCVIVMKQEHEIPTWWFKVSVIFIVLAIGFLNGAVWI